MTADAAEERAQSLERLAGRQFDLLVIGAGIIGSRVAYEAARSGLSVALVDAGDYGGSTSSASSKLLHGGLRYLSTGDLGLVRLLHAERRAIAQRIAPHLVEPLPLVLAVEGRSRARRAKLAAALGLYGALSGLEPPRPRRLEIQRALELVPSLRPEAVGACGLVSELRVHDARLTLATVRAAVRAGAVSASYTRVLELERRGAGRVAAATVEDALAGGVTRVRFQAVVNAAGPCVDAVRSLEDAGAAPLARLSLGIHAVVPLQRDWRGAVALFDEAGTALALPWQGMLLIGATDEPYGGDPGSPAGDPAHVETVLGRLAAVLPPEQVLPSRVVHVFAGLRVLPLGTGATARARRRHVVGMGTGGMVSIAGGKLTTHRVIAVDALRRLPPEVRPRLVRPTDGPLGRRCDPAERARLHARVEPAVARHLRGLYGADALRVVADRDRAPDALERIHPDGPDIWAQVDFARAEEWALTAEDVVARRTTLAVRGLASPAIVEAVEDRLWGGSRRPLEVGVG